MAIRAVSDTADTFVLGGTRIRLALKPRVPATVMVRVQRSGTYRGYLVRAHKALFQLVVK